MKRRWMVICAAIVLGGTSAVSAVDIPKIGGDSGQDWTATLISSKETTNRNEGEVVPVAWIGGCDNRCDSGNNCDRMIDAPSAGNHSSCCSSIPRDWLTPCGGFNIEVQSVWLRAQQSERDFGANKYDNGMRYILGHTNSCGHTWRTRYFNYFTNDNDNDSYKLEYLDLEHARRFALAGGLYGELSAGLRWAEAEQGNTFFYSDTIGPVIAAELRGLSILKWDTFASIRHSIQFGTEIFDDQESGTFSVTEMQLGVVRNFRILGQQSFMKSMFESQTWSGLSENDTEDLGLVGLGVALGTTF